MTPPNLVIFDCDGVLVDSEVLINETFVDQLSQIGIDIPPAQALKTFTGLSKDNVIRKLEADFGILPNKAFLDDLHLALSRAFRERLEPIPGVIDLVDRLKTKKCVASGSSLRTLQNSLGKTGLWDRFAPNIFSVSQVAHGKPAPDLFLFAAEKMNEPASQCLVIEDSVAGVRAAKAAHMRVFGFTGASHCGNAHGEELAREGAEKVFSAMRDLADILPT